MVIEKPAPNKSISDIINRLSDVNNHLENTLAQTLKAKMEVQSSIAMFQEILGIADFMEWKRSRDAGVFISYSHADKEIVNSLTQRFEKDSIHYWLDEKELLIGDVIDKAISIGIQKSQLFIIVLSPISINSKWVEREFDEASHEEVEGKKIILPVVVKNLTPDKLPPRIRRKLFVDLSSDFDGGYQKLKKSILTYMVEFARKTK
ncbi:MAG: toll/interleukin-1 receptor domain-containing protein [Chloroflexi bacterium]|nr:toll/interleukin-1 receptor domain-containing protein [Chloroflexota bacterium]